MRQDGRNQREQAGRDYPAGYAEVAPRPIEHHKAAEYEERQVAEPHARHGLFGMMLVGDQVPAFQLKARLAARARAGKVREPRDQGARPRRMLELGTVWVVRQI